MLSTLDLSTRRLPEFHQPSGIGVHLRLESISRCTAMYPFIQCSGEERANTEPDWTAATASGGRSAEPARNVLPVCFLMSGSETPSCPPTPMNAAASGCACDRLFQALKLSVGCDLLSKGPLIFMPGSLLLITDCTPSMRCTSSGSDGMSLPSTTSPFAAGFCLTNASPSRTPSAVLLLPTYVLTEVPAGGAASTAITGILADVASLRGRTNRSGVTVS